MFIPLYLNSVIFAVTISFSCKVVVPEKVILIELQNNGVAATSMSISKGLPYKRKEIYKQKLVKQIS